MDRAGAVSEGGRVGRRGLGTNGERKKREDECFNPYGLNIRSSSVCTQQSTK